MMKPPIITELISVSPETAEQWLIKHNYTDQRRIRPVHVDLLARAMVQDHYRPGSHIEFAVLDAVPHLVDGQHSLSAVVKSGCAIWFLVHRRQVGDITELRRVYATFGRELQRTPADVLNGLGLPETLGLTPKNTELLAGALRWILNDFRPPERVGPNRVPIRDLIYLADQTGDWRAAMGLYLECIANSVGYLTRPLRLTTTVAIALALLNSPKIMDKAAEFWTSVAHDDGLGANDPRKAAVNFLALRAGGALSMAPTTRIRGLATIWNAAYTNQTMSIVRPAFNGMIGVTLAGTRFRARRPEIVIPDEDVYASRSASSREAMQQPENRPTC